MRGIGTRYTGLLRVLGIMCVALTLFATTAAAQQSGIEGIVSDESNARLPGVTVVISSEQLIGGDQVRVTDGEGIYAFRDLPIGLFRVSFDLPGFATIIREDIRLTTAFTASIDATMAVGAVQETVTVSGQSPVVDVTSAATIQTLTREIIEAVPTSASQFELMAMSPGMRVNRIDVGGSTMANYQGVRAYGQNGQITPTLDGVNTRQATGSMGSYYDFASLEEVTVTAVGNTADIATAGMAFAATIKSGTNAFHGDVKAAYQNADLQGDNIDQALMDRGITAGNEFLNYSDYSVALGGPVWRDRIWFFADARRQQKKQNQIGFSLDSGPDGIYATADDSREPGRGDGLREIHGETVKLTFQLSQNYKLDSFYHRSSKVQPERYGTQFRPLENTNDYLFNPQTGKVSLSGTPSNQVVFTGALARHYYLADYQPRDGVTGTHRFDRDSRVNLGGARRSDKRPRNRWQYLGDMSYYPGNGDHAVKVGVQVYRETHGTGQASHVGGNFFLEYEGATLFETGMVGNPDRIIFANYPVAPTNRVDMNSVYAMDDWRVTDRLTANVGVRFENYSSYVPVQTKGPDDWGLFVSGTFPRVDVVDWTGVAPRIGLAYDVAGDGRTVIRGTYNYFNHSIADSFSSRFNQNGIATATFDWSDQDGNNTYTPGEVDLDLNGPDFERITAASTEILPEANGQNFKQPTTQEVSVGIERELTTGLSTRAVYVYKRGTNLYQRVNVLRPFDAYTIEVNRRDPGPDGQLDTADDGGMVTFFDYDPAFRGAAFTGNQTLNGNNPEYFHSVEFTLQKRLSDGWQGLVTFIGTQNHLFRDTGSCRCRIAAAPHDLRFPVDETFDWNVKAHGSYLFAYDIQVGAFYQVLSGAALQRTARFGRTDPDGLSNFSNLGTTRLRMSAYGDRKLDTQHVVHLKLDKRLSINNYRTRLTFEVFNLFNTNTILGLNQLSGSTFDRITELIPPRVARVGVSLDF